MQATRRKDERRKSAEWIGFLATITATAMASASTANTTNAQPAEPVSRAPGTASAGVNAACSEASIRGARSLPEVTEGRSRATRERGVSERSDARPRPACRAERRWRSQVASERSATDSFLLDDREGLDVRRRSPVGQFPDVEVERVVPVVRRHLVRLGRQPDRLRVRRAGLFAQLAEHAALEVDVEAVEHLDRLSCGVLLVVPVDVDDVDRTLDRTERALDTSLLVESEHPPEPVRRQLLLFWVLDRHFLLEEVPASHAQPVEEVEERQLVQPLLESHV